MVVTVYDLQWRLKGEWSEKVFGQNWKDKKLRRYFALGILFEEVFSANDPPTFVLHEVKDTVQTVKKGDVGMKKAVKDEMAATDPMKTRQQAFQFIILCISGFFVFLATFFSGLLRGSAQSGRVNLPYFSKFLVAFKSAGDLGDR